MRFLLAVAIVLMLSACDPSNGSTPTETRKPAMGSFTLTEEPSGCPYGRQRGNVSITNLHDKSGTIEVNVSSGLRILESSEGVEPSGHADVQVEGDGKVEVTIAYKGEEDAPQTKEIEISDRC